MIDSRELISATRQLGSMTEAGVDILRAIKVLRAQTQNGELVALYDRLAQELRLGSGLPDAMSRAPEAFSAFAVSLVRQGEARGDLATSFYRIADYLQKEREVDAPLPETPAVIVSAESSAIPDQCPPWLRRSVFRSLIALGGLLAVVLVIEIFVALGVIEPRWHAVAVTLAGTIFLLGAAWRLQTSHQANRITRQPLETEESTFSETDKSTFDPKTEATFE